MFNDLTRNSVVTSNSRSGKLPYIDVREYRANSASTTTSPFTKMVGPRREVRVVAKDEAGGVVFDRLATASFLSDIELTTLIDEVKSYPKKLYHTYHVQEEIRKLNYILNGPKESKFKDDLIFEMESEDFMSLASADVPVKSGYGYGYYHSVPIKRNKKRKFKCCYCGCINLSENDTFCAKCAKLFAPYTSAVTAIDGITSLRDVVDRQANWERCHVLVREFFLELCKRTVPTYKEAIQFTSDTLYDIEFGLLRIKPNYK